MPRRVDPAALAACLLVLAWTGLYLFLVIAAGEAPPTWVVVVLAAVTLGTGYAARRVAPWRRMVLLVCAVGLGALGWVALLTIGMPLLLAAALCVLAFVRGRPAKDWRDAV
ncbi:MAG: hypothetical protein WB441_16560 [Nocardioidaceae bacterium]